MEEVKEVKKPKCKLVGTDGNIFYLVGVASQTLKKNGLREEAAKMQKEIFAAGSYDEALCILDNYVDIC